MGVPSVTDECGVGWRSVGVLSVTVSLRPATLDDVHMVYQWRNRTDIIENSTLEQPVVWSEHEAWFSGAVNNSSQALYIVEKDNLPVGQLRFDQRLGNTTAVSIYLLPEHQGKGYGVTALKTGCSAVQTAWKGPIVAHIRLGNKHSESAFMKAGFQYTDIAPLEGHYTLEYVG